MPKPKFKIVPQTHKKKPERVRQIFSGLQFPVGFAQVRGVDVPINKLTDEDKEWIRHDEASKLRIILVLVKALHISTVTWFAGRFQNGYKFAFDRLIEGLSLVNNKFDNSMITQYADGSGEEDVEEAESYGEDMVMILQAILAPKGRKRLRNLAKQINREMGIE